MSYNNVQREDLAGTNLSGPGEVDHGWEGEEEIGNAAATGVAPFSAFIKTISLSHSSPCPAPVLTYQHQAPQQVTGKWPEQLTACSSRPAALNVRFPFVTTVKHGGLLE